MKTLYNNIEQIQGKLKNYALKLTGNPDDANDLVQETFLKAITNESKFAENSNLDGWLMTILKNSFINKYRKDKKISYSDDFLSYYKAFHNNPESEITLKDINESINGLESDHRITFDLFTKGYKYHEISEITNVPLGTVKSRIFFSRKKLSEKLADYAN
ncbi:MAG: sigma-70 family RNA polymerase sigma factor [Bacteroidales bacterium]|jgi:RNA polymerase sigma-70 factor (ECF subfamily)|nr:sigma-70 family RNA polymerase sigma factor [Bacteroidales bacterium]